MDIIQEQDGFVSIDMVEMGVRPFDWIDDIKQNDNPLNKLFGEEKTIDFTVYSADLQFTNNIKKITTNENDSSMSDDDDNNNTEYDVDPETGEKIFREANFASKTTSPSSSNDKWIEEYLSNIESSSNQTLPNPTTINNSELIVEDLPLSLIGNIDEQTDTEWFSTIFNFDDNSQSIMFTDSEIQNEFIDNNNENKSNQTTITSPIYIPLSNDNNINISNDDETSISSNSNNSQQNPLYSSLENDNEIILVETKSEKIDLDENPISQMMTRRSSTRSIYQGQQDEDALRQYNIPLNLEDITHSSTEEYNRHLARLTSLSNEQIRIIKDIRRRGKNKIAAQNCRKRKATNVESLLEEVDELKRVKHELEERKRAYQQQIADTRAQYEYLHRQVLPDRQLPPAIIVK